MAVINPNQMRGDSRASRADRWCSSMADGRSMVRFWRAKNRDEVDLAFIDWALEGRGDGGGYAGRSAPVDRS
ncbi:hypothetical protein L1049_012997 [Liquidambar formosana]|uniref:Uncharacterized protein n=1 Tax=Liquidambar formosana TaxID=63359 RepID=A0AAP0RKX8_LIQFO